MTFETWWDSVTSKFSQNPLPINERVAAFDADGTLWDTDLGEIFFEYQIQNCRLQLPPQPWDHYHQLKKADLNKAYLWLAQISAGQKLEDVKKWAQKAFDEKSPFPIFKAQKLVMDWLLKNQFEIYIVTASVKWAVEPGAKALGLSEKSVLGFQTKVNNGVISTEQEGIATYKEGKRQALLKATNGRKPWLAAGNTLGDQALLESAQVPYIVAAQKEGDPYYASELQLKNYNTNKMWPSFDLRKDLGIYE